MSRDTVKSRDTYYLERSTSETLIDLHVYVMPPDLWRDHLHSAISLIINETISAGFMRIHPETMVHNLRDEITKQVGYELVPRQYVFLRAIGRCFTKVKSKQEREMKAKHFMPPHTNAPEIFVLDIHAVPTSNYDDDELDRLRLAELLRRQREEEERLRRRVPSHSERDRLRREIARLRALREEMDRRREELMRRAKFLKSRDYGKKNLSRDVWKKKYFEEKKKSPPKEDDCNKLRDELEQLHRKILGQLEGVVKDAGKRPTGDKTYQQALAKIKATRYEHDVETFQTRLQTLKMKLTAEMRLRNQAERELQGLKSELAAKKVNVATSRNQVYTTITYGVNSVEATTARSATARSLPNATPRWKLLKQHLLGLHTDAAY